MAFWTDTSTAEPLRQNRWYMRFGFSTNGSKEETNLDKYQYALKECSKPQYKIETSQHVLINHSLNYPKNVVWQPVSLTMISAVDYEHTLSSTIQELLRRGGYDPCEDPQRQISKKALTGNGGIIEIYQIDEYGLEIEIWTLHNSFFSAVDYGALTYENDGFVDVKIQISYDYATFRIGDMQPRKTASDMIETAISKGINQSNKNYIGGFFPKQSEKDEINRALTELGVLGNILKKI